MALRGEWNQKGATLSNTTAQKEFGITPDFIAKGIRSGKLEFRKGEMWGNPYIRLLRSQLEKYIADQLGTKRLQSGKTSTELGKIKRQIRSLKKQLVALEARRKALEGGAG